MNFDPDKSLFPTHTCFDDSAHFLRIIAEEDEAGLFSGKYQVCHGIMVVKGVEMAHAWVETDESCFDMKIYKGEKVVVQYDKPNYYKNITKHTKYTIPQVIAMDKKFGGCGPWGEEYKALCGTDKTMHKLEGEYGVSNEVSIGNH